MKVITKAKKLITTVLLLAALAVAEAAYGENLAGAQEKAYGVEKSENTRTAKGKEKVFKSKNGWQVTYNTKLFTVNESDGNASFVYQGKSAGTNLVEITYIKGKKPKKVINEKLKEWKKSSDDNKVKKVKGKFIDGRKCINVIWYPAEEGVSGLMESLTAVKHKGGTLLIDNLVHMCGDEELDETVCGALENIASSMKF